MFVQRSACCVYCAVFIAALPVAAVRRGTLQLIAQAQQKTCKERLLKRFYHSCYKAAILLQNFWKEIFVLADDACDYHYFTANPVSMMLAFID
ncbi:hypothetical protein NECAME_06070 [Necator americanus]|uniref:Uncharacterized protein n=1 Tax=Necator americanus TaxID=51031 RepID=W2TYJ3_NECAM|nr:hypothetical protein NECAME_06070 [Necator americanus]ETN86097.1 hypothetical protein NECAME_06070 [Necator americanus]